MIRPLFGSITSPNALTATIAATITSSRRWMLALPIPAFIAQGMPKIFPTVAPQPAPTLPCFFRLVAGIQTSLETHLSVWAHVRSSNDQVEKHSCRYDRHFSGRVWENPRCAVPGSASRRSQNPVQSADPPLKTTA